MPIARLPLPARQSLRSALCRLDRLERRQALLLGGALGAATGAALLWDGGWAGYAGFGMALLLAGGLAWSGEPLPIEAGPAAAAEPPDPLWADIPAGSFLMGGDGQPQRKVTVSAFRCQRTPVTRRLYREIMGSDPGWPGGKADERPVNNVSWFDAVEFCNRWSQRDGLQLYYRIKGEKVLPIPDADGYRLLTEAEWEYACRAGSTTTWSFGDDEARLGEYGWFEANSGGTPHPVSRLLPNNWGLYDLHGNVWEWVWDRNGDYSEEAQTDPQGPPEGIGRVLRGGAFGFGPWILRAASRNRVRPDYRFRTFGFRCARAPRRQP
ncbi:MAG: formylglycine-generating enzyme family protein [Methylococcaceae bacterium]|nr:formylglycine-generating enzyme family protein [Methylococcaceae bacterium]